jgi:hypothetical protein
MTASVSRSVEDLRRFGRLWWLPAGGYGNGLDDDAWAPVLEISEAAFPAVLAALRSALVPAYAAARGPAGPQAPGRARGKPGSWQLWVGASAYGRAEAVLLTVMPHLTQELGSRGDRAWR